MVDILFLQIPTQTAQTSAFDDWDSEEVSVLSEVAFPKGILTQSTDDLCGKKAPAVCTTTINKQPVIPTRCTRVMPG